MFADWLKKELKNLGIDISVYHGYLIGILEDNIDENEKREMITDIVSSLVVWTLKNLIMEAKVENHFFLLRKMTQNFLLRRFSSNGTLAMERQHKQQAME